ncbi:Hypothetical protein CINCED_3A016462 [Cinara cedri]|uniref:PEHE domain-containing protein n=1 Tax=Cinara cedri TaxID=506608 RepID=A0A5E4NHM6_9HEMI|nr:Hypothetical protein CINCED_3A016462 [Cinara cedri]
MSFQCSREVYAKRSDIMGRKRKIPSSKSRPAVLTRSMAATAGTTNNGQTLVANDLDGPSTENEMEMLTKYNNTIVQLKRLQMMLVHRDKKIKIISRQNSYLKLQLTRTDQHCTELNLKKKDPLNELPCTPVSSTCLSGTVDSNLEDLNSTEPLNKQIVESKNLASSQGDNVVLDSSLDQLKPSPKKQHKTKNTSTRPRNLGKMREFIVVTENGGYYTCLGDFDPNEDRDVCYRKRDLELPSWRIKSFSNGFPMDAADICSETIEQIQYYSKCEKSEQKRKRWDLQRARELRQIDYLKEGRYKKSLQNLNNENTEQDMRSLLPNPDGIDVVRVTDNLPVSAFGCNLHIKKNAGSYKFHYSQWCNDGTGPLQEDKEQEIPPLEGGDPWRCECKV